jgi:hypothetical protein
MSKSKKTKTEISIEKGIRSLSSSTGIDPAELNRLYELATNKLSIPTREIEKVYGRLKDVISIIRPKVSTVPEARLYANLARLHDDLVTSLKLRGQV